MFDTNNLGSNKGELFAYIVCVICNAGFLYPEEYCINCRDMHIYLNKFFHVWLCM